MVLFKTKLLTETLILSLHLGKLLKRAHFYTGKRQPGNGLLKKAVAPLHLAARLPSLLAIHLREDLAPLWPCLLPTSSRFAQGRAQTRRISRADFCPDGNTCSRKGRKHGQATSQHHFSVGCVHGIPVKTSGYSSLEITIFSRDAGFLVSPIITYEKTPHSLPWTLAY